MDLLYLLKNNFNLKSPVWLINHWKKLQEFALFIKLFVITKMKILKNTLERFTRHWIRPCLHNTFYGHNSFYGAPLKIAKFLICNIKINACFIDCTTWCSRKSYQLIRHKENSRSLSGVIKSSSVLKFGMVAKSTTLISRFADFISKTGSFG